jgi:hypothetical protein
LKNPIPDGNFIISVNATCGDIINKATKQVLSTSGNCNGNFYLTKGDNQNPANGGCFLKADLVTPTNGFHYWQLEGVQSCPIPNNAPQGQTDLGWNGYYLFSSSIIKHPNPPSEPQGNPLITSPSPYGYLYPGLGCGQSYALNHYYICCGKFMIITKCAGAIQLRSLTDNNVTPVEVPYEKLPKSVKEAFENYIKSLEK